MDVLGFTEIPQHLIVDKRRAGYTAIAPPGIQRDHAGSRTMTHRHMVLYVDALELVCLGDACVEVYEKGVKIIKDGIASLAESEDHRDGLGLEGRRVIAGSATTDANANANIGTIIDGEQQVQVDTLAGLGGPEKKRKARQPTKSRDKPPYEELSKKTGFCSVAKVKGHKKSV
jgi:hypothetical protein